jgi:type I restriction enzyme S subunit
MKTWKKVKLGSLLTESKIISATPNVNKRITVKLNVHGVEKRLVTTEKTGATKYYERRAGQFIYGKQNLHKGAFGIVPKELEGFESSSDIPAFDVDNSCYPEWIFYFFKKGNFYLQLESLAKGVGSKRIHPQQIFNLDIFLPEKEEQKEILDKIAIVETKHKLLRKELEIQENGLVKFRQSLLDDAIRGKLTEDWRNNYSSGTGEELLNQLRTKKRTPIKKSDIPFSIPNDWAWCRLNDVIVEKPRNGYSPRAVNFITKTKSLRLGATTRGFFDPTEVKYLEEEIQTGSYLWLEEGDILIQRSNSIDYVGVSAIYDGKPNEFIYPDLMMKIKVLWKDSIKYIYTVLSAPYTRQYFRENASGTSGNMPKINQEIVQNTLIPLPPIMEQIAIVEKLERLTSDCDKLEESIKLKQEQSEALIHSLLLENLGNENNSLSVTTVVKKEEEPKKGRVIKYSSKTTLMELIELLDKHGKLHAEDLWRMSKQPEDIDAFYADLKHQIEVAKTIKEVTNEKGYLELA